ncbi:MAG: alanine racemase [Rhodobacteraceae bacterium]|nr:alanine racemase [Paracoccaceae bacterium]
MATGILTIDLDAVAANWRALNSATAVETAAVVKADGYGLGAPEMATTLARAGARRFFVATAEEGALIRTALGPMPEVFVFSGHMAGDTGAIRDLKLTPLLNSIEQMTLHFEALHGHPFGIQLDSGMNRLGLEPAEWVAARDLILPQNPALVMSHLACADEADHPMNAAQLKTFRDMTDGISAPRSLAATGGILLGPAYHFDLTRPGVGLYGGLPFDAAQPVVGLSLPVIQTRTLHAGETVGYGGTWEAPHPARIATVSGGYADGLLRAAGGTGLLFHKGRPCQIAGRVSMDLIGVDVTHLTEIPQALDILGPDQTVDDLAEAAGTIGYEILTLLGARYHRTYLGGVA